MFYSDVQTFNLRFPPFKMAQICRTGFQRLIISAIFYLTSVLSSGCGEDVSLVETEIDPRSKTQTETQLIHESEVTDIQTMSPTTAQLQIDDEEFVKKQESNCANLLDIPPQGISCLHCTKKEARQQARMLTQILLDSCLKNIAISYLIDGSFDTFEISEDFLRSEIARLTSNGRSLHLFFYMSNGPLQRRLARKTNPSAPLLSRIAPEQLRQLILDDREIRSYYEDRLLALNPLIREVLETGGAVGVIPMLEDNFDDASFQELYDFTANILGTSPRLRIGRSPCPRCYPGNGRGIPDGAFLDQHTIEPNAVRAQDGLVTNDGSDFSFASSKHWKQLAGLRNRALQRGNTFILWSAVYQGLPTKNGKIASRPHPKVRNYALPTASQVLNITRFFNSYPN